MKKILASVILLCGIIVLSQPANAQEEKKENKENKENQRPNLTPEERASKRVLLFKEKLGLDEKQTAAMKSLLMEREKSSDKLREQLKKEREDFEAQTKKILTADQFLKLKDLQDDRKDRRQEMKKGTPTPTPPPAPAPDEKK